MNTQDYVIWDKSIHQTSDPWDYIFANPFNAYITVYLEVASAFFGQKSLVTFNSFEY